MKTTRTITFFIFLFSRHGRRCFKAQAEGLRLSMRSILLSILIAGTLLVYSSCDNESGNSTTDTPADRAATITFGTGLYTTVTGHMTAAQWKAVIPKLTAALNAAANTDGIKNTTAFLFGGVANIDLVKTQEYSYYKLDSPAGIFLFNADFVIEATQADLSAKVVAAILATSGNAPEQE